MANLSSIVTSGTPPANVAINKNQVLGLLDSSSNVTFDSVITKINAPGNLAGWSDNIMTFSATGKGGNAPTSIADSNGIQRLRFGKGDEVFVDYHVNHDYALTTLAFPHIHWMPLTTMVAGETVIWLFDYVIARGHQQGESLLEPLTNIIITHTADGTELAGEHMVTECQQVDAFQLLEPDTVISARVRRSNSDTYTGNIYGLLVDLHFQVNTFSTKNKSPDFYI